MTVTNAMDTDAHGREIWSMNVLRLLCLLKQILGFKINQKVAATQTRCVLVHLLVRQSVFQTMFHGCGAMFDVSNVVEMHSRSKFLVRCHKTIVRFEIDVVRAV